MMTAISYAMDEWPFMAGGYSGLVELSGTTMTHFVFCQPIDGDVSCVRSYAHTPAKYWFVFQPPGHGKGYSDSIGNWSAQLGNERWQQQHLNRPLKQDEIALSLSLRANTRDSARM